MSKNFTLMRDVICPYHPDFRKSKDLRHYGMKHSDLFNAEKLVEHCLAAVGGYDFVDEVGRDFNDRWNSDSKTATVIPDGKYWSATVQGVENKIGSLRVIIYNPFKKSDDGSRGALDFMYIPHREVQLLKSPCYGKNASKERLVMSWYLSKDYYSRFDRFIVEDFTELATAGG